MPYPQDSPEAREFQALGVGLILYSAIFVGLLAYGWFHIIGGHMHPVLSWAGALVMAGLAWTLARIAGSSAQGLRGNKGFFAALLLVSAVGVFNTLMIRLEGKAIFNETIDRAVQRYSALPGRVRSATEDREVAALRSRVDALRTQLAQEIANPRNCGEGPEAAKLLAQLKAELPGLVRYSGSSRDCSGDAQLVRMYDQQIDTLLHATPTFVRANVQRTDALRRRIEAEVPRELAALQTLRKDVDAGVSLTAVARPRLEDSANAYQRLAQAAAVTVPALAASDTFRTELDIDAARRLGEWGHLLPLLISRMDRPQTLVYLALAVFLDWLLVQLFARIAAHRRAMPAGRPPLRTPPLGTPW